MEKRKTWQNEKAIGVWFSQLAERTKENYRNDFPRWIKYIDMTPNQQVQKRINDLKSNDVLERRFFERKLVEWKRDLEKKYRESTVKSFMRTTQSFFKYNGLPLRLTSVESRVHSTIQNIKIDVPSNEEIRAIYSIASKFFRCAILVSYQSGFDSQDTANLRIEDIGDLTEGEHKFIIIKRKKTSIPTHTCISQEASHDILTSLRLRGMPEKGYLITSAKGNAYSTEILNKQFKKLSKRACGKKFTFKSLRKAYKREMNRAKIADSEIKQTLIGHSIGVEANYSLWESNPEPIIEAYNKMFPLLSINGYRRTKEDLVEVKEVSNAMAVIIKYAVKYGNLDLKNIMKMMSPTEQEAYNLALTRIGVKPEKESETS